MTKTLGSALALLAATAALTLSGCNTKTNSGHAQPATTQASTAKPTQAKVHTVPVTPTSDATEEVTPEDTSASPYVLYSLTMTSEGYPVLSEPQVLAAKAEFCTATQDEMETGLTQYVFEHLNDSNNDSKQAGAEIGATMQAYCPTRFPVFQAALADLQSQLAGN